MRRASSLLFLDEFLTYELADVFFAFAVYRYSFCIDIFSVSGGDIAKRFIFIITTIRFNSFLFYKVDCFFVGV